MTRTRRTSSSVPRGEPAQGRRLRGRCGELCAPSRPHPTQCPHLPASGCARGRRKPAPRCWGSHAGALEPHDLHSLYSAPPPSPHAPPSSKLGLWGILGQSALQLAPPPSLDQSRPPHPLCHSHQAHGHQLSATEQPSTWPAVLLLTPALLCYAPLQPAVPGGPCHPRPCPARQATPAAPLPLGSWPARRSTDAAPQAPSGRGAPPLRFALEQAVTFRLQAFTYPNPTTPLLTQTSWSGTQKGPLFTGP